MEEGMNLSRPIALIAVTALTACSQSSGNEANQQTISHVQTEEQAQLHRLDAINLAIALKRAIHDSGYTCQRIVKEGFVGQYKNLDMWSVHCSEGRDWAIYAGPDGSAQVRDCVDVAKFGLPKCEIREQPQGSLTELPSGNETAAAK